MLDSLSAKNLARLLFYPAALGLAVFLLLTVAMVGHFQFEATQDGSFYVFLGGILTWYVSIGCALAFYVWAVKRLRSWAAGFAMSSKAYQIIAAVPYTSPARDYADKLMALSNNADWSMLSSLGYLFVLACTMMPTPTHAHAGTYILVAERFAAEEPALTLARKLQGELQLNEHGFIRALKYLRQGYSETEVRNLFAAVVTK